MKTLEPPVERRHAHPCTEPAAVITPSAPQEHYIRREVTTDQICILTFDRAGSPANILDRATLAELDRHLRIVAANPRLKGLVLHSAKPTIFIAGADIKSIAQEASSEDIGQLIELGQSTFDRLATLSIPTVAAIHGACVGGGYEICLSCDHRMASPDKCTRIGLPETLLGILPGWGGSTRLPRLIGLPAALDIILAGKTVPAKLAKRKGLIDEVAPKELLLTAACSRILQQGDRLKQRRMSWRRRLVNLRPVAALIARQARRDVLKRTRGQYPAVLRALEVASRGLGQSIQKSQHLEKDAVMELSQTTACRNLIRIFLLQERAKKLSAGHPSPPHDVQHSAVIGAGIMGSGIAQWISSRGISVVLRDINREQVSRGMGNITKLYHQAQRHHVLTPIEARAGMDRVIPSAEQVPLGRTELVIEAAVESMELKKRIFAELDAAVPASCILATNTSALSISEIAASTRHPERVVGIHFFNPVHRMQLVEIVQGRQTSPDVLQRVIRFVQQIGKLPVLVQDRPGFLVNRILVPYLIEAGRLFESGASVEDIDAAMLDFGMPMGPLRLIDEVGVDVARHVAATLAAHFSTRISVPKVLDHLMTAGQLGRKSGAGFYLHAKGRQEPRPHPDVTGWQQWTSAASLPRLALQRRMALLMVNEAARCLEERVVAEPADVDFGMVMGTGFAPFHGGPLRWADTLGLPQVVQELQRWAATDGPTFAPCELLLELASHDRSFYQEKGDSR